MRISIGSLNAAYANVNDALFLGKSADEIARIHAANQGTDVNTVLQDPSIQLFTNPTYRASVTQPPAVSPLSPVPFAVVNADTGQLETWQRDLGAVSRTDAERIAGIIGGTVSEENKLRGQQTQDYTITLPNGVKVNASDVANHINNAQTPEAYYSYITQFKASTTSPAAVAQAKQQAAVDAMLEKAKQTPIYSGNVYQRNSAVAIEARNLANQINAGSPTPEPNNTNAASAAAYPSQAGYVQATIDPDTGKVTAPKTTNPALNLSTNTTLSTTVDSKQLIIYGLLAVAAIYILKGDS